ncbi:Peptidyl-tRNA hydrolase [compost metagenome]
MVIVYELALPFGRVQLKPKGGSAGHNGLKNIETMIGTQAYPRIRFGIGDNFPRGRQVDYVLSGFDDDEIPQLPLLIDKSIEMIKGFTTIGIELAMTRLNK